MWGEGGVETMIAWSLEAMELDVNLCLVAYGNKEAISGTLSWKRYDTSRLEIVPSTKDITDDEAATEGALLRKIAAWKKSSLNKWILWLKEWNINGLLTAWNTASAILLARRALSSKDNNEAHTPISIWFPRVDLSDVLTPQKEVLFLDAWGHTDETVERLVENQVLACEYLQNFRWIDTPKVWLLNMWVEQYKWDTLYKETRDALHDSLWDGFVWNIEANRIFTDTRPDMIVSSWMMGNVVLKTAEWVFWTIEALIKQWVFPTKASKYRAPFTARRIKRQLSRLDPNNTPDGKILWLDGLMWHQNMSKLHGNVKPKWVRNGILRVAGEINQSRMLDGK